MNGDNRKIVGISIARKNPYGRNVILDSIRDYMSKVGQEEMQEKTIFVDDYTGEGYGKDNSEIMKAIRNAMICYGIPLDSTYTGKAFYGMQEYMKNIDMDQKKVLFLHTGGTPLFFDDVSVIDNFIEE